MVCELADGSLESLLKSGRSFTEIQLLDMYVIAFAAYAIVVCCHHRDRAVNGNSCFLSLQGATSRRWHGILSEISKGASGFGCAQCIGMRDVVDGHKCS